MPDQTDSGLRSLAELADSLFDAEEDVLRLGAELKRAAKKRDAIAQGEIPELMRDIGVATIVTTDGAKVELKDVLSVTPLKKNRPRVMQVLVEEDAGSLIKTTVLVPFNRDEDDAVVDVLAYLTSIGRQAREDRKVEAQTLKKWVKDRLEAGEEVDMELFGVRKFEIAQFSDGGPKAPIFDDE
jgi:hypothetical protein